MNKALVRERIINARLNQENQKFIQKSAMINSKIAEMKEFKNARTVMIYLDFRKEVETSELVQICMEQGKMVLASVTVVKEKKLIPSLIQNFPQDITKGTWGIPEPRHDCIRPVDPKLIDLIIVPGVAFDLKCNRLGYGGGFYDRFLREVRESTVLIAPAFDFQILDHVYPEEHDCPVHYVVTEERTICQKSV